MKKLPIGCLVMTMISPAPAVAGAFSSLVPAHEMMREASPVVKCFDDDRPSPPDPLGFAKPKPESPDLLQALDDRLRADFEAAAGPNTPFIGRQQAADSGWGFVSDHFDAIDGDRDGQATYDEVQTFLDVRSPLAAARARAAAKVQVVE